MKYAFALAAVAGLAAAHRPGHERFHKRDMVTVTHWDVVTVTDIVTVFGPSPAASSSPASSPAAPPAQSSPSDTPKPSSDAPAPKPTSQAPKQQPAPSSTPAAAPTSAASNPPSSGGSNVGNYGLMPGASAPADCTKDKPCQEGMTTYTTGLGACGYDDSAPNDADVVALQMNMFGSETNSGMGQPKNPLCNKRIQITNPSTGATAVGVIRDRCQGCTGDGGIDLSPPLWAKLNNNQPGNRLPVEWYFLD